VLPDQLKVNSKKFFRAFSHLMTSHYSLMMEAETVFRDAENSLADNPGNFHCT